MMYRLLAHPSHPLFTRFVDMKLVPHPAVRRVRSVLDLYPMFAPAGAIGMIEALRDNALMLHAPPFTGGSDRGRDDRRDWDPFTGH
jgi:hypothetical protein